MSIKCSSCGNTLENDSRFCEVCGSPICEIKSDSEISVDKNSMVQSMPFKIAIFSAIVAMLGFCFKKVDSMIGGMVFSLSAPLVLICMIVATYNYIFGKTGILIKFACFSIYGAMIGYLMGIQLAITAGVGICFVIVAIEAFKKIFLHK